METVYKITNKENKDWYFALGQSRPGSKNGRAKVTEEQVRYIREQRDLGKSKLEVFKDFKHILSNVCFDNIWYNKSWKCLL